MNDTGLQPVWRSGMILLVAGALATFIGALFRPDIFLSTKVWTRSYLFAVFFWMNLALGGLVILMMHELTPGRWGNFIHESRKASASALPLIILLFIPLLPAALRIFPWSPWLELGLGSGSGASAFPSDWHTTYLSMPFFTLRTFAFLLIWLAIAAMMRSWTPGWQPNTRARQAAVGLVLLVPTATLFSVDWILSFEPKLADTMIGFTVISGQICGGLSTPIIHTYLRGRQTGTFSGQAVDRFQDLGNMLLAGVMFYGYIVYMNFLIIWSGNLPAEIQWFTERGDTTGLTIVILLVLFHIALPTALLMSRRIKRSPRALFSVALIVLAGRWVDIYWLFKPLYRYGGSPAIALDTLMLVIVGFAWLAMFDRNIAKEQGID